MLKGTEASLCKRTAEFIFKPVFLNSFIDVEINTSDNSGFAGILEY